MEIVTAPSNIALIKYMGKIDSKNNTPTNSSLSYTLEHLKTAVQITETADQDDWQPLVVDGFAAPELSEKGKFKYLAHLQRMKDQTHDKRFYQIRSANNFPSDCGLASSASSFAALTKAYYQLQKQEISLQQMAKISQKGSGSSCRSFFSPWSVWRENGAEPIYFPNFDKLLHAVVVVHAGVKTVSSSEAHVKVLTSPLFAGRGERARRRLEDLIQSFKNNDWKLAYEICRDEYIDMHELFETSVPAFKYRNEWSQNVVMASQHIWNFKNDGPLVTMDAGPNVHLLWRPDQIELANKMVEHFKKLHVVMTSWRGLK